MDKHVIIDKSSKLVKRWGYCEFTTDPETEEQIIKEFEFDPDIEEQNWYWNSAIETFQETPPE